MNKMSYIYSIEDKKNKITEVQLCLSHEDLIELRSYCDKKDFHRNRGYLQGNIIIGRNFAAAYDRNSFPSDVIINSCHWVNTRGIQESGSLKWYKKGIKVSSIDYIYRNKHLGFLNISEEDEALLIQCDRHCFECFFQYIKGFTEGYWGDVFEFSSNFITITSIHDYNEDDLNKLNENL